MFLRRLDRFADGFGDLAGLAEPGADPAILITDDHERAEGEATAALDNLGDSVQVDDLLRELRLTSSVLVTHALLLELQPGAARRVGQRLDSTVIGKAAAVEDHGLDARLQSPLG